jgi:hypothetical protein
MVLLTILFGRDAGLHPRQLAILSAVSVLLAAGCIWIISWEER